MDWSGLAKLVAAAVCFAAAILFYLAFARGGDNLLFLVLGVVWVCAGAFNVSAYVYSRRKSAKQRTRKK